EPAHRDAAGGGAHGADAVAGAPGAARAPARGDRRADPHDAELLELRGAAAAAPAPARAAPASRGGVRAVPARCARRAAARGGPAARGRGRSRPAEARV